MKDESYRNVPIRNLPLTASSPCASARNPQASPAWRCPCTSPRPPRRTSGASWWRSTPSSSPGASSPPASWTAPSATCSATDGGQAPGTGGCRRGNGGKSVRPGLIPKSWLMVRLASFLWVLITSNARKSHTGLDARWKCQCEPRSAANICPPPLFCIFPHCHSKCSTWTLRSMRKRGCLLLLLLLTRGLAFPRCRDGDVRSVWRHGAIHTQ